MRIRSSSGEIATFYADVVRGAFQLFSLQWVGGNEQPDIFSNRSIAAGWDALGL
jgi:peptide/nickel transport system substrate-binding protein